jgi:hypothetical protein
VPDPLLFDFGVEFIHGEIVVVNGGHHRIRHALDGDDETDLAGRHGLTRLWPLVFHPGPFRILGAFAKGFLMRINPA